MRSGGLAPRPPWGRLLPEMLRPLGYRSYHSGKWHIEGKPLQNGFDHSYRIEDYSRHFGPRAHSEEDVPLPPVAKDTAYYSSAVLVGKGESVKWTTVYQLLDELGAAIRK